MLALHINPYQDSYPSKQKVYIFAFTYPKKRVSFISIKLVLFPAIFLNSLHQIASVETH